MQDVFGQRSSENLEIKVYCLQDLEFSHRPWGPRSEVSGRDQVSEVEHRPGDLLLVGVRGEAGVLRVHSLRVIIRAGI